MSQPNSYQTSEGGNNSQYPNHPNHYDVNYNFLVESRDKEKWASLWRSMYSIACGFDSDKTPSGKFVKDVSGFIKIMLMICTRLPCEVCRTHSTRYFQDKLSKLKIGDVEYRYRMIEKDGIEELINVTCLNMVNDLRVDVERRQHRPKYTTLDEVIIEFYLTSEECNSCKINH